MQKIYFVDGKRTPFGKFGGAFKDLTPTQLAVEASRPLLEKVCIGPSKIDHVIFANVIPSSTDTLYGARHTALMLGLSESTPGYNVNRLCGSGIQAVLDAMGIIQRRMGRCVLVVGAENMSMIPHLVYGARFGTRYGELKTVDMLWDTLFDKYAQTSMGMSAENLAKQYKIGRQESDDFSYRSHQKALKAYQDGRFSDEIVSCQGIECLRDEHLREDIALEEIKNLKPLFTKNGTVTSASASGIVDGGGSCLVASKSFVEENHLDPLAEIVDGHVVGVDPKIMGIGPVPAIRTLLEKQNYSLEDIDFFEINEAFAAQVLSCIQELNIPEEKLNVWGGALALGHPLGVTGIRIILALSRELHYLNGTLGVASACIGGGQGIALLLKRA